MRGTSYISHAGHGITFFSLYWLIFRAVSGIIKLSFDQLEWEVGIVQAANISQAILSSCDGLTSFSNGEHTIRFRTSPRLERYTSVKEWDHGYLVVTARYQGLPDEEEEYIDLVPILKNLYFDPDKFLDPIRKVSVRYEQ